MIHEVIKLVVRMKLRTDADGNEYVEIAIWYAGIICCRIDGITIGHFNIIKQLF